MNGPRSAFPPDGSPIKPDRRSLEAVPLTPPLQDHISRKAGSVYHSLDENRSVTSPSDRSGYFRATLSNSWATFIDSFSWDWWVTLTFPDHLPSDYALRLLRRWLRRLSFYAYGSRYRKKADRLSWCVGIEKQLRGVIHFHLLIKGVANVPYRRAHFLWETAAPVCGYSWIQHHDASKPRGASSYLSKYIAKGADLDIYIGPTHRLDPAHPTNRGRPRQSNRSAPVYPEDIHAPALQADGLPPKPPSNVRKSRRQPTSRGRSPQRADAIRRTAAKTAANLTRTRSRIFKRLEHLYSIKAKAHNRPLPSVDSLIAELSTKLRSFQAGSQNPGSRPPGEDPINCLRL